RRGRRHRLHRDHRLTRLIFLPSSFSFLLLPPASPEPSQRKRMIKRKENDSSLRLPPLRPAAPLRLRAFALKFVSKVRLQPTLATKSAKDAEPQKPNFCAVCASCGPTPLGPEPKKENDKEERE